MKGFSLTLFLLILILLGSSYFDTCNARRGKHWRQRRISASLSKKKGNSGSCSHHHKGSCKSSHSHAPTLSPTPAAPVPPALAPAPAPILVPPKVKQPGHGDDNSTTFNVMNFGAKGDGTADDTKAFQAAWAAACKVRGSTIVVPFNYTYLVGPISFAGPYCQEDIVFQLDGTIIAPTEAKAWSSNLLWWIEFTKLKGIAIRGSGVIDGRGSVWWNGFPYEQDPISIEFATQMPKIKPTALRFYGSFDVTISGITIQNSPQCHLKFDNCEAVHVYNMSISSPANSINTDGIHLQNSRDVNIHSTSLACGDDCVSIQTGCTNVFIHNVNCGPGHGISIGGLGKDNTKACVSNITVRDVVMHNTMNGVRIKTWQGGSGSVQGITFSNIQVSEVQTPIVIDQFYCDKNTCSNQTSAVALSGIHYERIRGTYTVQPVHFACSDSYPCTDLTLTGIQLQPIEEHYHMYQPQCWQTFGELLTPAIPPIDCLQIGKPSNNNIQSEGDSC